jgi:hypothetical protein
MPFDITEYVENGIYGEHGDLIPICIAKKINCDPQYISGNPNDKPYFSLCYVKQITGYSEDKRS